MGVIMDGFRRNDRGGITIGRFDSDSFPKDQGWFDAPEKVPPLMRLGQVVVPPEGLQVASKPEQSLIESNGTAALIPKQRGWPKGKLRGSRK